MNWSREELKEQSEIENRCLVQLRFDEIHDEIKSVKTHYVTKACFWKTVSGFVVGILALAWKALGKE